MKKIISLEQAFFGSDREGYHVLGISEPSFSRTVEKICSAIGTPDGFSEVSPFLISWPDGANLFMICCRLGNLDPSGRRTLFFHALWAERRECEANGINASVLLRGNVFVGAPAKECQPLSLDCGELSKSSGTKPVFPWRGAPLTILSHAPCNDLLEAQVGQRSTSIPWASFSFSELPEFRIYALSKFVLPPSDRDCCDISGKIISRAQGEGRTVEMSEKPFPASGNRKPAGKLLPAVLIISLILNVFLCYRLICRQPRETGRTAAPPAQVSGGREKKAPVRTASRSGLSEEEVRKKVLSQLAAEFPDYARIGDLRQEIKGTLLEDASNGALPKESVVFKKMIQYVDFVNNTILNIPSKEDRK